VNSWWAASLIAPVSWSKTLTRPTDDSRRSICTGARRRTPFHLDSAPVSRCTDSECTAAYCCGITCKLRALAPGTFSDGSFDRLPPGGWILVPSRTAGLVKESSVLPYEQQLERPRTESYPGPFGSHLVISKVHCWLECGFATGWSSRCIGSTVSYL
jgi:hypothetical protein